MATAIAEPRAKPDGLADQRAASGAVSIGVESIGAVNTGAVNRGAANGTALPVWTRPKRHAGAGRAAIVRWC